MRSSNYLTTATVVYLVGFLPLFFGSMTCAVNDHEVLCHVLGVGALLSLWVALILAEKSRQHVE